MPRPRLFRRVLKGLAVVATLAVLGVALLLGSLGLEQRTAIALPAPTGTFAVGRATYDWAEDSVPGAPREVLAWLWYPAVVPPAAATVDYLPALPPAAGERARITPAGRLLRLLTRDAANVHPHSLRQADVAPQERPFPVVILRAGASASALNYTSLAEDLASHGYVVVGFDAPYRTGRVVFPDGRLIEATPENNPERCVGRPESCLERLLGEWTADIGFLLDRLARLEDSDPTGRFRGRLDMTRVGLFGHSFGGAQAARFCQQDPRCKAGVDIDGFLPGRVVQEGARQPFMILLSDHSRESDPESRRIMADIQSFYERLPPRSRLQVAIRGAHHFTFSDDGALLKSALLRGLLRVRGRLGIDGRRQLALTSYCLRAFFDASLKRDAPARPDLSSPLYPELEVAR